MRKLAVLVGAVTVAVFATAALTGNAGVRKQTVGDRTQIASLQKQVNELRNELICLDTIAGNDMMPAPRRIDPSALKIQNSSAPENRIAA